MEKTTVLNGVSSTEVIELLEGAYPEDIFEWEGTLIDNYIITNIKKEYKGCVYDNIIALEVYKNEWTSEYKLILTNDTKTLNKYLDRHYWEMDILEVMDDIEKVIEANNGTLNTYRVHYDESDSILSDNLLIKAKIGATALYRYTGNKYKIVDIRKETIEFAIEL